MDPQSMAYFLVEDEVSAVDLKEVAQSLGVTGPLHGVFKALRGAILPGVRFVKKAGHKAHSPNVEIVGYRLPTDAELAAKAHGLIMTTSRVEFRAAVGSVVRFSHPLPVDDPDIAEVIVGTHFPLVVLICRTMQAESYCSRGATKAIVSQYPNLKFVLKVGAVFDTSPVGSISVLGARHDEVEGQDVVLIDGYLGDKKVFRTDQCPMNALTPFVMQVENVERKPSYCTSVNTIETRHREGFTSESELGGIHDALELVEFRGELGMISVTTQGTDPPDDPRNTTVFEAFDRLEAKTKQFLQYLKRTEFPPLGLW